MDPTTTPNPSPESSSQPEGAPQATGGEGATAGAASPQRDPMKGLPPIRRAEVVGSEGTDGGRPGRPGGFGGRGPRERKGPNLSGEKVPDTRSTLRDINDEQKSGGTGFDAELNAEIEAMMEATAAEETGGASKGKNRRAVTPMGGPAHAHIRGPRLVEAGRERRTGTVVSVGPQDIFLEFGPKELGVLQRIQFKDDELPAVGSDLEVVVDRFETAENLFICSRPGAVVKAEWELLEVGQVVEARVTGVNKGGLELEVAGHRAFMPAGQVSLDRVADLSVFVGEKFPCTVVQIDRRGLGNIVLSRKDVLREERKRKGEELKKTLAEGQVLDGVVRKIMPFGAFVDLGGLDGLLHMSDISYDRVLPGEKNIAKHVQEGQAVKVQVLKVDLENNKISLGTKQLMADPFATITNDVREGAEVAGRVVRLTEFGAFVELAPGVDGLVHISEISRRRINKPEDVLKVDQVVQAKVLKIDAGTRKISLSIKALLPVEAPAPGSREARFAEKKAEKDAMMAARLAEIQKETPELRRKREKFRGKELTGGFGKGFEFLGGGLGDLKIGQ